MDEKVGKKIQVVWENYSKGLSGEVKWAEWLLPVQACHQQKIVFLQRGLGWQPETGKEYTHIIERDTMPENGGKGAYIVGAGVIAEKSGWQLYEAAKKTAEAAKAKEAAEAWKKEEAIRRRSQTIRGSINAQMVSTKIAKVVLTTENGEKITVPLKKDGLDSGSDPCSYRMHRWHLFFEGEKYNAAIVAVLGDHTYAKGDPSERAFRFVQETAPESLLGGKKLFQVKLLKISSAEWHADGFRLHDKSELSEAERTKKAEKLRNIGKTAAQSVLKKRGSGFGLLNEFERPAGVILQLVCRRAVVEKIVADFKEMGKIQKDAVYKKYASEIAAIMIDYLFGDTDEIPQFDFRIFPQTAEGDPVVKIMVGEEQFFFDRESLEVSSTRKKWILPLCYFGYTGGQNRGWDINPDPKKNFSELPSKEIVEKILEILNRDFPKGTREIEIGKGGKNDRSMDFGAA